jgi:hypothetical protein
MEFIFSLDKEMIFWTQEHIVSDFLTPIMIAASTLGDFGAVWLFAAVTMICTRTYRRTGIAVLIALAVSTLVGNAGLKNLIMRERPFIDFPDVPLLTALEHSYSFPSGHTFSSFAAATAIAIGNRRWAIAAMGTAALIGFSRVYLFMHYPSDVLGGALLGIAFGALAWKYSGRLCRAWQTEDYKD